MNINITKKFSLTSVQVLVIGFAIVIFMGSILLMLPISSAIGKQTPFVDCLFISTSATCVTGLVTLDTGTHWSYFGKTVIIILIEMGGLGFMSFATLFALILGRRITLRERLVMQEALNSFNLQGLVKLVKYVLIFTGVVQLVGAMLLATQFIPEFGIEKGIYYSIFHSISAYCNAGFDLMGNFKSLTSYYDNSVIILTIALLIVIGGLGFYVLQELYNKRSLRKLSLNTKLVLIVTVTLIVGGTILMYIAEVNNEGTIKNMSLKGQVLSSIFASITPRTAGYNSISTASMSPGGKFLTIILMFIGGSPSSTAGGVKTTTVGLLIMTMMAVINGREDTEIFKKRIAKELVYRAVAIVILAFSLVTVVSMILSLTEVGASMEYIIYEVVSAFGTVGLTLGLTPELTVPGKFIIALTMYCGRVGPLTVAIAFAKRHNKTGIRYPEDKIIVG